MSVTRKLFITIVSFIVAMCLVFAFVTQIVLKDILNVMVDASRTKEVKVLSDLFIDHYEKKGGSWEGVQQLQVGRKIDRDAGLLLLSPKGERLYHAGAVPDQSITLFGIRSQIPKEGKTIAFLYYYDPEVAHLSKLRMGIRDSTTVLLIAGATVFVLLSLPVAYWLSKRLTAPLRSMIPAIDRLGQGELGIQVPVVSRDEYGKTAKAFNEMSQQLQQAEEIRRNLFANVAHELRTPLTILQGKLEWIQQRGQPVQPESLLPLQDELIRLNRLVDDLHQLSLAEAKKLPLDQKPTDIPQLLSRIIDRIQPDADRKGVEIRLHCDAGIPSISVDSNRITQVFLNLLTNALRYTPPGGSVKIDITEKKEGLQIQVSDTGVGIPPEHLPHLFNRFYRTDESRARSRGGMGLGLAIAKEFVMAHHGTIEVESTPDQGTTFIVELPFQGAVGEHQPVLPPIDREMEK